MSEIETDTDLQLLARYTRNRAEDAFAELVRRHLGLVHSAALRQVRFRQLAEEVAQSVFTDLARNAAKLSNDAGFTPVLAAWLYQVTRRTAIDVVRREARRQLREQIATEMNTLNANAADWTHIEPLLDDAMAALDETDRAAVLLRYFENKSLREVGATLGTSDDAAQKRVSRAVERLREFFTKRGVTVGASGLVVVISANAIQAAPVGLAVSISTAAAAALAGTTIATTTIKFIAMTTLQKALLTTTVLAAVATPLLMQHQSLAKLRSENNSLRDQLAAIENASPSHTVAMAEPAQKLPNDQFNELLRLRGEVGRLRRQAAETAKPAQMIQPQSPELSATEEEKVTALQKQQAIAKMGYARNWTIAFLMYADKNGGRFPTNFDQAAALLPGQARDESMLATNQFDIFYTGSLNALTNGNIIVIGESQAQPVSGGWVKTYGFADGHSEVHKEADGNFEAWEKQHMILPP